MTRYDDRQPVTAGVDGTQDGLRAAEFAAIEASRTHRPLRLLHACHVGTLINPMAPMYGVDVLEKEGVGILDAAEKGARSVGYDITIDKQQVAMSPAAALVQASKTSALVVVGRRTVGRVERFLAGSTSQAVASKAHCPLVSVPVGWHPGETRRQVVVGSDGADEGRRAIEYAFEEASRRSDSLLVVRCWEMPVRWYLDVPTSADEEAEWADQIERALAEDLAGYQEQFPEVTVRREVVRAASPAHALCEKAEGSSLLVVGKRGIGGVIGLDLGWTAHSVLAQSKCPVAVVHRTDHDKDDATIPALHGTTSVSA